MKEDKEAEEKIRRDLIDPHLWFAEGDLKYLAQYLEELGYCKSQEIFDWLYEEYGFELQPEDKKKWGVK